MLRREETMRVKRTWQVVMLLALAGFAAAGCASMFMKGGSLAPAGFQPQKVLVTYHAEGSVPPGTTYLLVMTEKGEAMFEQGADGSGALFETRWTDSSGDHFAGWVATSHAYEFIVPKDRRKPAKRYVYPKGYYSLQTVGDQERPVPVTAMEPVATLYPK
jgi:hypothetical protein